MADPYSFISVFLRILAGGRPGTHKTTGKGGCRRRDASGCDYRSGKSFALVKFYKAARSAGVKPLLGVDAWIRDEADSGNPFRIVLLVQNAQGYRNILRLVSRSYREGQHLGRPMLDRKWLDQQSCSGLIAPQGTMGRCGSKSALQQQRREQVAAGGLAQDFGDRYYLELQRTGREQEEECLHASVDLAQEFDLPVVATNDVRFLDPEDFEAHEIRVCIHDGRTLEDPRRSRIYSPQQYLRSPEQMAKLFSDIPEALSNSVEIAKRCTLELSLGKLPSGFCVTGENDCRGVFQSEILQWSGATAAETGRKVRCR